MKSKKGTVYIVLFLILSLVFLILAGGYTAIKSLYKLEYKDSIIHWSEKYDLDPYFVASIIRTESRFKTKAVSSAGACGLMQIMPDTGEWIAGKLDVKDYNDEMLFDADTNIRFGCWYLRYLFDKYDIKETVCAAYNAGPTRVSEWLNDKQYSADKKTLIEIPFEETSEYVERVKIAYEIYTLFYEF